VTVVVMLWRISPERVCFLHLLTGSFSQNPLREDLLIDLSECVCVCKCELLLV